MIKLIFGHAIYPVNITKFPDQTSQVWKTHIPHGADCKIKWDFESEAEIMHLVQLKHLLDAHSVTKVTLDLSYLPYGRQDKPVSNETTFALHSFTHIINSLNFSKVAIQDPHSHVAGSIINNSTADYPTHQVTEACLAVEANLLCYPDAGAVEKYTGVYNIRSYIYGEKARDPKTGNIVSYTLKCGNLRNQNILIVDDICDGGATFIELTKQLRALDVATVSLFVTHGIFSKGTGVLFDAGINRVFTAKGEIKK